MAINTAAYPIDISSDPFLEEEVERELAPYRALVPPELAEVFRDELILALLEDRVGASLLRRARPVAMVTATGPREIAHGAEDHATESGIKVRVGDGK